MIRRWPMHRYPVALLILLAGCAATRPSPVVDFSSLSPDHPATVSGPAAPAYIPAPALHATPWRHPPVATVRRGSEGALPASGRYKVRRGDTVHRIARRYGLVYKDLVTWNNLTSPYVLYVGQIIRLTPGPHAREVTRYPVPEERHRKAALAGPAAHAARQHMPDYTQEVIAGREGALPAMENKKAPGVRRGEASPGVEKDGITWGWPAAGRIIAGFKDHANDKGVDIAGKVGEPVYAAASGTVVYSGSGLRGYGQLIIIKHSKTYLSAYAHNHRLLVKEGQHVKRGQEIAEMGSTDADQPKLHFEVRRLGKPVDPLHYLPTDRAL